LSDISTGK